MTVHGSPRAQHEALAAVAHDLRLPLTHIKGFVSSLRRADVDWDDNTRSEFLAEIELETDRLAQFVDSLLTPWSVAEPWLASGASHESISAGEHVAFTDPASVLDGALHRIRCLFGGRKVRRKVPAGLSAVRMDASEMERALANLLQNAIKYSPPGTPIGISARIIASNELEFTIDDEGPGIPAEDRERIFEQPLLVMHPLPHGARSIDLQPLDDLITACGQLVPRCSVLARRAKLRTDACHECRPTLRGRTTAWTEFSFAGRTPVAIRTPSVDPGTSVGLCEQALDKPSTRETPISAAAVASQVGCTPSRVISIRSSPRPAGGFARLVRRIGMANASDRLAAAAHG